MHIRPTFLILSIVHIAACSSRGGAPHDPGNPAPAAGPQPGITGTPRGEPGPTVSAVPEGVPVRAEQAPLVHVRDALESRSLLGRRVRIAGRCTAVGAGRTAGSWLLEAEGVAIEVRGRVPASCSTQEGANLTIFAQIEPKAAGSRDRLLLRLPD